MDENICRTCLSKTNNLESIFDVTMVEVPLTEVLSLCTGIKVSKSDKITKLICGDCQKELRNSFSYRLKCWESQAQLIKQLELKNCSVESTRGEEIHDESDEDNEFMDDDHQESNDTIVAVEVDGNESVALNKDKELKKCGTTKIDFTNISISDLYPPNFEYKCRCCRQICKDKNDLREHLSSFHECRVDIDKDELQCEICLKIFKKMYFFVTHIKKIHHRSSHILCHFCGVLLIHKTSYQMHFKQHVGEKPFKCDLCDYRATQKNSINLHMRSHTGEKPFKCNICGKSYATLSSRSQHKRSHFDSTPSECTICNKTFKRPSLYKSHMRIHNTEKHFKCSFCERTFVRKHRLREHLLRSHKDKH